MNDIQSSRLYTSLDEAIRPQKLASGKYRVNVPLEWCAGRVAHGGYVTAVVLNLARIFMQETNYPHQIDPVYTMVMFLSRQQIGETIAQINLVKSGRNYSVVRVVLSQGNSECVHSLLQMGNLDMERGPHWLPEPDANFRMCGWKGLDTLQYPSAVASYRHAWRNFDERIEPSTQSNEISGWYKFKHEDRKWDIPGLGVVVDLANPVPHMLGKLHWHSTLVLEIELKRRPDVNTDWVNCFAHSKQLVNGRYDLDVEVKDDKGNLLCISRHVTLVLDVERNIRNRGQLSSKF